MNQNFERIQLITAEVDSLSHFDVARKACEAGVKWIQYRNKNASPKKMLEEALRLKTLCKEFNATLIINDNPNLAFEIGADGVHLGKDDVTVVEAKKLTGNKLIIGASCHNIDDIVRAQHDGADYVGLGPFRFTNTKSNLNPLLGIKGFEKVMSEYTNQKLTLPVYAIGGVTVDDVELLLSIGVYGVAISSAITASADWRVAFKTFQEKFIATDSQIEFHK